MVGGAIFGTINPNLTRFDLTWLLMKALPVLGSRVLSTNKYGRSLWGLVGKIAVELPDGKLQNYFLKVSPRADPGD